MGWFSSWFGKKQQPARRFGLVEAEKSTLPRGCVYSATGYVAGFPYRYTVRVCTIGRGRAAQETAISNQQIIGEIFRLEKRQLHKGAINALFFRGNPNYLITIAAYPSQGAPILLLETEVQIPTTYFYAPAVILKIAQAVKWTLENFYADTQNLSNTSKIALWGALRYPSPQTRQFWFNVIIQTYVGILSRQQR